MFSLKYMKDHFAVYLTILTIFVLFFMTLFVRLSRINKTWCEGCTVTTSITITQPIKQTVSNYTIAFENMQVICERKEHACQKLTSVTLGNQITVSGMVERQVIASKNSKKRLIHTTVASIHLVKATP